MEKIKQFPIMFFSIVMGFCGFSLSLEKLGFIFIFEIFRAISLAIFCLIFIIYFIKIIRFNEIVKNELNHPVKMNFFAAFSMSLALISALLKEVQNLQEPIFWAALIFQSYFSLFVISSWIRRDIEILHSNPAWFIPVAGNLLIASLVPNHILEGALWPWFYFSFALFFWLAIFSVLFYRLIFHPQMPSKFMPTLFIFIAPPAVAFLGYLHLGGSGELGYFLLSLAIFFAVLLAFMWRSFFGLKFFISWWAFTFPLAALCLALLKGAEIYKMSFLVYGAWASFTLLSVMILLCSFHTIKGILDKSIFE